MGISAERLAGYFCTSASKRAASCGEKIDIFSESLAMHQLPGPCLCFHIHLFLVLGCSQPSGFSEFQLAAASVLAAPADYRTVALQSEPCIAVPHRDPFFAQ